LHEEHLKQVKAERESRLVRVKELALAAAKERGEVVADADASKAESGAE